MKRGLDQASPRGDSQGLPARRIAHAAVTVPTQQAGEAQEPEQAQPAIVKAIITLRVRPGSCPASAARPAASGRLSGRHVGHRQDS